MSVHCPKNNQNLCIKINTVSDGADGIGSAQKADMSCIHFFSNRLGFYAKMLVIFGTVCGSSSSVFEGHQGFRMHLVYGHSRSSLADQYRIVNIEKRERGKGKFRHYRRLSSMRGWPPAIAQLHNVKKDKYKYWKVVQGHTNTQKIRRKLLHLPLSLSLH